MGMCMKSHTYPIRILQYVKGIATLSSLFGKQEMVYKTLRILVHTLCGQNCVQAPSLALKSLIQKNILSQRHF